MPRLWSDVLEQLRQRPSCLGCSLPSGISKLTSNIGVCPSAQERFYNDKIAVRHCNVQWGFSHVAHCIDVCAVYTGSI